jgi:hypothetical protein
LIEVFSLFCLSSRPFRIFWLSVMVPFHLLTLIFMNIFFWQNLLLFPLLLCEVSKLRFLTPSRSLLRTGDLQPAA